jgi:hypothetical protein
MYCKVTYVKEKLLPGKLIAAYAQHSARPSRDVSLVQWISCVEQKSFTLVHEDPYKTFAGILRTGNGGMAQVVEHLLSKN